MTVSVDSMTVLEKQTKFIIHAWKFGTAVSVKRTLVLDCSSKYI